MLPLVSSEFSVIMLPKLGSTSLRAWAGNNTGINESALINTKKEIYCCHRPSFDRIITGVNTGLNYESFMAVQDDKDNPKNIPEIKTEYNRLFREFVSNKCMLTTNRQIYLHTRLLSEQLTEYELTTDDVIFFNLSELNYFPEYINKKYTKNYTPMPWVNRGDGGDKQDAVTYLTTVQECKAMFSAVDLARIKEYAEQEPVPNNIINLK